MSLRTRLILAFVLLSVVPLSAVTLYSYSTSVHAFQRAVEREAQQSAADIGHRMTMVTDDLGRRMDQMFEGTSGSSAHDAQPATSEEMRARVAPALGDAAVLVERVEFEPTAPALPPTSMTTAGAGSVPPPPAAPPAPPTHATPPVPPVDAPPATIVVDMG